MQLKVIAMRLQKGNVLMSSSQQLVLVENIGMRLAHFQVDRDV